MASLEIKRNIHQSISKLGPKCCVRTDWLDILRRYSFNNLVKDPSMPSWGLNFLMFSFLEDIREYQSKSPSNSRSFLNILLHFYQLSSYWVLFKSTLWEWRWRMKLYWKPTTRRKFLTKYCHPKENSKTTSVSNYGFQGSENICNEPFWISWTLHLPSFTTTPSTSKNNQRQQLCFPNICNKPSWMCWILHRPPPSPHTPPHSFILFLSGTGSIEAPEKKEPSNDITP